MTALAVAREQLHRKEKKQPRALAVAAMQEGRRCFTLPEVRRCYFEREDEVIPFLVCPARPRRTICWIGCSRNGLLLAWLPLSNRGLKAFLARSASRRNTPYVFDFKAFGCEWAGGHSSGRLWAAVLQRSRGSASWRQTCAEGRH